MEKAKRSGEGEQSEISISESVNEPGMEPGMEPSSKKKGEKTEKKSAPGLARSTSLQVMELSSKEEKELRNEGSEKGPLWMVAKLFPSAVVDASVDPVQSLYDEDWTVDELAARMLWKSKVLSKDEFWARFNQVFNSVVFYRHYSTITHRERQGIDMALDAIALWTANIVESEPHRVVSFFAPSGPFQEVDSLLERIPSLEPVFQSLIVNQILSLSGGAAEKAVEHVPRSRILARFLSEMMIDEDVEEGIRGNASLALSLLGDFAADHKVLISEIMSGEYERKHNLVLPRAVRWSATKYTVETWEEAGSVSQHTATKDENGLTLLARAVASGNEDMAQILLRSGSDIESLDKLGKTPLIIAAEYGRLKSAEVLVNAGAHVLVKDTAGWSALMHACKNGHHLVVDYLVSNGAEMQDMTPDYKTPLMIAAMNGQYRAIEMLCAHGVDLSVRDARLRTAFLHAVAVGSGIAVNSLIQAGCDITVRDADGENALSIAAAAGHLDVMNSLLIILQRKVAEGTRLLGLSIDEKLASGMTPLMIAAMEGHVATVKQLLEAGADPLLTDAMMSGRTALDLAALYGQEDCAKVLKKAMVDQRDFERNIYETREKDLLQAYQSGFSDVNPQMSFVSLVEHHWK